MELILIGTLLTKEARSRVLNLPSNAFSKEFVNVVEGIRLNKPATVLEFFSKLRVVPSSGTDLIDASIDRLSELNKRHQLERLLDQMRSAKAMLETEEALKQIKIIAQQIQEL